MSTDVDKSANHSNMIILDIFFMHCKKLIYRNFQHSKFAGFLKHYYLWIGGNF
jgi:hypothetical protein